jgi:hypothetical protein
MIDNPLEALGPPPFRFVPAAQGVSGPSFTRTFKALATVVVFGTVGWFAWLWLDGRIESGLNSIATWFAAGAAMMLYTWWHILRSTTRLDAGALHQSWVWDKNMELRELAYGKLIRVRGLEWLIAPRLYVRTLMGKFAVFYAADPDMLAEFERLIRELKAFRGFQ